MSDMLDDVVHSWESWVRSPRATQHLVRLATRHPDFETWTLDELRSPRSSPRTDAMQAALVAEAQRRDNDALATLIVQLRPGLVHLIGWAARNYHGDRWSEADDDVVGLFGETVLHHRLDRRPRLIAANLLLDTRQKIWRAEGRESRCRQAALTAAVSSAATERAGPWAEMQPDLVVDELTLMGQLADAIRPETALFFTESPTNPYLRVIDVAETARVCHDGGVKVVIDSTFATPVNHRALDDGADLMMKLAGGSGIFGFVVFYMVGILGGIGTLSGLLAISLFASSVTVRYRCMRCRASSLLGSDRRAGRLRARRSVLSRLRTAYWFWRRRSKPSGIVSGGNCSTRST